MPLILRPLVQHLRRLATPIAAAAESDAVLLDRFVCRHDQDAFAAMVARHGPMVLRLCRRVLGNDHAAEDAFQACFLVLARRAGSIRHKDTLAAWLYAVALRLALRVRATARRQPAGFSGEPIEPADTHADVLATLSARDLLVALDEEIGRLPERYRLPVLLCCIEGRSQEEAARQLDWTPGSVKGRLERGRKRLHDRLVRRGLTLGAALAMAEIARGSAIGLPASLAATTVKAALAFGSAQAASGSVEAARLAGEVLAGFGTAKAKLCLSLLLVLGLTALGAIALNQHSPVELTAQPVPAGEPMAPKVEAKVHVDHEGFALPPEAIARIGSARFRSGGYIQSLGYLADGKTILVIDREGRVQLCDTKSGTFRQPVGETTGPVLATTWQSNGKTAFLFGAKVCYGLDLANGKVLFKRTIADAFGAHSACFSPDGSLLAFARVDGPVRIVEVATGMEKSRITVEPRRVFGLAFSTDGTMLAVGSDSANVAIFDVATARPRFELTTSLESVANLMFSPDGKRLLCAPAAAKTAVLMDLTGRKELSQLHVLEQPRSRIGSSAFSPDGKYIAVGDAPGANLYEAQTGKHIRSFPSIGGAVRIAFAADGNTLLMGGGYGELSQWDVHSGKLLPESSDPRDNFEVVRFLGDGPQLLVVAKQYIVYDWKTEQPIRHFAGPQDYFRSDWHRLAPDGSVIAWTDAKGISLKDAKTGKEIRRLAEGIPSPGHVHFSPDSRKLFFVGDKPNAISIADVATGRMLPGLQGNDPQVWRIAVSPDGRWLASFVVAEKTFKAVGLNLWDVETGRLIHKLAMNNEEYAAPMAFASGSRTLAIATGLETRSEVRLINVVTGKVSRSFVVPYRISKLAYSPDERTMAVSQGEGSLSLWEVATAQPRHHLVGHRLFVHALVYSPDGALLAASSDDAPALIWDVYGKHTGNPAAPEKGFAADHDRIWEGLGSKDAVQGFQMVRRLVRNPDPAVALLRTKLHPAGGLDTKRIAQWLRDLDSEDFDSREAASAELEKLGDRIEGQLQKARAIATLETQRRLDTLLAMAETGPDRLRQTRSLEALEQIATPPAVSLLETLAGGDRGARLTNEATAALARIRNR